MSDKYDNAVEFFRKHPDAVRFAWAKPLSHPHGCLFQWASRTGRPKELSYKEVFCGCLTMIRKNHQYEVEGRPDLTEEIRSDNRIPKGMSSIRIDHLPIFAEWQRRLDHEIRNLAPEAPGYNTLPTERRLTNGRV